jgi:DNA polymerase III alpha subunit
METLKEVKNDKGEDSKVEKYRKIFAQNSKNKQLSDYIYEKILAGYSYSHKLKNVVNPYSVHDVKDLLWTKSLMDGDESTIAGIVKKIETRKSKAGKYYCKVTVEDESCTIDCMIFDSKDKNTGKMKLEDWEEKGFIPKEGEVVIMSVRKWNDTCVINKIDIVSNKVYMKLADMKHLEKEKDESINKHENSKTDKKTNKYGDF